VPHTEFFQSNQISNILKVNEIQRRNMKKMIVIQTISQKVGHFALSLLRASGYEVKISEVFSCTCFFYELKKRLSNVFWEDEKKF